MSSYYFPYLVLGAAVAYYVLRKKDGKDRPRATIHRTEEEITRAVRRFVILLPPTCSCFFLRVSCCAVLC